MPTATATTTGTFASLAKQNNKLIRKPSNVELFLQPFDDPTPPLSTLVAVGGQIILPNVYESVGWLDDAGVVFETDLKTSEVRGLGSNSVLRRDISQRDMTAGFSLLQTSRIAYELQNGLLLRGISISAAGEWMFDYPSRPATLYWRALFLAIDGQGNGQYGMARYFPRATISDKGKDTWRDKEGALMREVTLGADEDPQLGITSREFLFGPGVLRDALEMGFTVAS